MKYKFLKILGLFLCFSHLGYGCDDFTLIEREDPTDYKIKRYKNLTFDTIQDNYQPFLIPKDVKIDDLRHIHNSFYPSNCYKAIVFYNTTKSNPFFIAFIKRKQHQHNEAMEHVYSKSGNLCWDVKEKKFILESKNNTMGVSTNLEKDKSYIIASLNAKTSKIQSFTIQGRDLLQQLKKELRTLDLLCSTFYNHIYIIEECD